MLRFEYEGKAYIGPTARDIVRSIEESTEDYPYRGRSLRRFLLWSLERLGDGLPPRDLDLSDRLEDDDLALSYLYLQDEYGIGRLSIASK
jgi:hypothetical protein